MANLKLWRFYILGVFLITGCVGGRTLTMYLHYDMDRKLQTATQGMKAAVIPFEDARGKKEIGKWKGLRGRFDLFEAAKPVDETVTEAAAQYLKKSGLDVSIARKGSRPEGFQTIPPHFVISGKIEELFTEATSHFGYTQLKTTIRLKISIRNVKDGSSVTTVIESISEPKTVVTFNSKIFEKTINDALSDGLERIISDVNLEGEVFRRKK